MNKNRNKNQQESASDSCKMSKLEKENEKLRTQLAELKEQKKQAEAELRKERKKKRLEGDQADSRATTITFETVKRYTYSGFMMMTATLLCVYAGGSPRKAVKSMEVFNHVLHGLLGAKPCHTTIRTWLAKMGLDAMENFVKMDPR